MWSWVTLLEYRLDDCILAGGQRWNLPGPPIHGPEQPGPPQGLSLWSRKWRDSRFQSWAGVLFGEERWKDSVVRWAGSFYLHSWWPPPCWRQAGSLQEDKQRECWGREERRVPLGLGISLGGP